MSKSITCACDVRPNSPVSYKDGLITFELKLITCALCDAAPELYQALKELMQVASADVDATATEQLEFRETIKRGAAALFKAEGR